MLHILRQIAKTGIKTEMPPSPDLDMATAARLQKETFKTLGGAH